MPDAGEPHHISPTGPRQRPWDTGVSVPLPEGVGFTDAERWAWAQIIRGDIADMRFSTGQDDGAGSDANEGEETSPGKVHLRRWPESRKLSARFFETILFHQPWASARAKPWVRVLCAWIDGQLLWENSEFSGEIGLYRCRFDERPDLMGFCVGRTLNFSGSRFLRGIDGDGLRAGGDVYFRDEFVSEDAVDLPGIHVAGDLDFSGATLMRGVRAEACNVNGNVYCRTRFKANGDVNFIGARIGCDFHLQGDATYINSTVDLTGATIGNELQFDQGGAFPPDWGPQARLVLRNVTCGALAGAIASFRRANNKGKRTTSVPVDLLGLSYSRIGGLAGFGAQAGATLADAPSKDLVALIQSDAPRNGVFTPQPYHQLADALMAAGREEKAQRVRFALLEHERLAKGVPATRKLALFLSRHLIGHGFENWRAATLFGLVAFATTVAGLTFEGRSPADSLAAVDWRALGDWGGYALGNAIPVLQLDPDHETFIKDRFGEEAPLWLKTVLYTSKLLGFVLLSYLAAGLTGFASRSARR